MNMGTGFEEIDIGSGKLLIYVVFGANRWEFEKLDQAEWEERIPVSAQGSLERVRSTTMYLLRNWKKISPEDRAMGEAGLTQDIEHVKACGFSIKGRMSYGISPPGGDARKYNASLRIVADE